MSSNLPKNFPGGPGAATPPATPSATLPKNFQPSGAGTASAEAAAPGPEVTRAEIAEHLARRLVALRDAAKGASRRAWLFAVENPFPDFEHEIAHAYARVVSAGLYGGGPAAIAPQPTQPLVMLGAAIEGPAEVETIVHYINHGQDVTVFCPRSWMLPDAIEDMLDATLRLPRFDATTFAAACADFYELDAAPELAGDTDWMRAVVPRDFLLNSAVARDEIVAAVGRTVERRLARYAVDDAFDLDDFSGMQEVRDWASSVVAEIQLARTGALGWNEIESRIVLTGGRGVGKTSLTRAIARAAGVRFLETSAASWLPTEKNPAAGFARCQADFDQALGAAPAVFFIDDIDVFAMPQWAPLTGLFLQYLKMLRPDEPLVIVAGAESSERVRFELRRRGALESTLVMPAPGSQVLARMYQRMMHDVPHALTVREFEDVGRLSLGLAGHDVDLIVRRARRRARKDGNRAVTKDDLYRVLSQERFGQQAEGQRRLMAEDELRNTAYHEAGHAILQLMRTRGAGLAFATIIPRANGTLGFVLPNVDETRNSATRRDLLETIRVCLAGRVAEELLGGSENVTTGCSNDLQQATLLVQRMLTRAGFNGLLSLDLTLESSPELRAEAARILDEEYANVTAALRRHRRLLDRVAGLLIERQEVSGDELAQLYAQYRAANPDDRGN